MAGKSNKETHAVRIDRLEGKVQFILGEALNVQADSLAEQISALQAILRLLADKFPEYRMVKCQSPEGGVYYDFKTIEEIEAQKNDQTIQHAEQDKSAGSAS